MPTITPKNVVSQLQRYSNAKEYHALKETCRADAVEWRWATGLMLPQFPHDQTVFGWAPPKWVAKPPRIGSLHGLDAEGRIVAIRSGELATPDENVAEQFLIHEAGGFWVLYFGQSAAKPVNMVTFFEMRDGRWLSSLRIRHPDLQEQVLRWEGDRLMEHIQRTWEEVFPDDPKTAAQAKISKEGSQHTVSSYTYGADGALQRLTRATFYGREKTPGFEEVKYNRLPKEVSLPKLLKEVEELLVAEVPRTIKAARIKETVYCLLLQFSGVDTDPCGFAPPMILAPESTRARLMKDDPKNVSYYAWAIDELRSMPGTFELSCKHAELEEKLNLVFQITIQTATKNNYGPVRKMFQRVAARLNERDWKGILKTTDDFVVFPCDNRGEMDPREDLKASVPAKKVKLLMERGFLERTKGK